MTERLDGDEPRESHEPELRWSPFVKRTVALILFGAFALVLYGFRYLLPPLMIAFLLAFILNPIVGFIVQRLHLSRNAATAVVFLILIGLMLGGVAAPVTAVPTTVRAVRSAQFDFIRLINDIGAFFERPVHVGEYTLDLSSIYQELSATLTSFVGSVAEGTLNIVLNIASGAFWLVVILMTTFYLVKDTDRFVRQLDRLAPLEYRADLARLRQQIAGVWNAFLRGQLVISLLMAIIITIVCIAVGLPYAPVMGLISGLTEFIPNVGPAVALIPAALVALFKGSAFLPLSNFWFMVLVIGLYMIIQQIENNLLVPRIMGESLNLHPMAVLIGIIIGGNMAGIIGMLLAAPVLATLRVIVNYLFSHLYDRDPFAETAPEKAAAPPKPSLTKRVYRAAWRQVQEKVDPKTGTETLSLKVSIRKAELADKPAIESICIQMENPDYIPDILDEWLADPHGQFAVAELRGDVVGFAKLTRLADDEWWLEGLRVASACRAEGIAGRLQAHLVKQAQREGDGALRFGTRSDNEPVHRLAAHDGFHHTLTYRRYQADPLPSRATPPLRQLTEVDVEAAWTLVRHSPRYQAARGLYEECWTWKNLTRERLERHITAGDVWGLGNSDGLPALALVGRDDVQGEEEDVCLYVGYVDGTGAALVAMLQGLRGLAARQACTCVRIKAVAEPALATALQAAGYEICRPNDVWIFELELSPPSE
ncbi:MAG TPA: AI-2E family transporter [Chloroflexi bacterium]|nr:AI-2E family transporter [Chloroflexota bacterium]